MAKHPGVLGEIVQGLKSVPKELSPQDQDGGPIKTQNTHSSQANRGPQKKLILLW